MDRYDLVVIGGGPAGTAIATDAAGFGKKVALIERNHVGGTCLNRGCIPTKALLYASHMFAQLKDGEAFGVQAENIAYSWDGIMNHMRTVIETQRKNALQGLKHPNITVISGEGTLFADGKVCVVFSDGSEPSEIVGEDIVIAAGGEPVLPPIQGIEHAISSDTVLDTGIPEPKSMVIIGGGIIGIEFATFFSHLGIPTTVIEALPSILSTLDEDVAKAHAGAIKKEGVDIRVGHKVVSIESADEGFVVKAEDKEGEVQSFSGDVVLCAVGRRSVAAKAIDESAGVELYRTAVVTSDGFKTSAPHIYAVGDSVAGNIQLAHVASSDGHRLAKLLYDDQAIQEPAIPSCVYTVPEIAQIGDTASTYIEKGGKALSVRTPIGGNARTVIAHDPRSFIKLTADSESGKLVGAVIYASHATELIDEAAVAIAADMTVSELIDTVMRPHPTYAESFEDALRSLQAKL